MKYEAYIHINGKLQLKRMIFDESGVDFSSPFVAQYLGVVESNSPEEAITHFQNIGKLK